VATIVEANSDFLDGGKLRRVLRFYHESPRIDFVTEVHDVPASTVLSVEFPFAERLAEVRRGVPFGFSHGAPQRGTDTLTGITQGILPAIQFTDYTFPDGSGVALLDRGIPGRELTGNNAALILHNVLDAYALSWKINDQEFNEPSKWLNAQGKQVFEYALYFHPESWEQAAVPQAAWEYNSPVVVGGQRTASSTGPAVETSDNVIVPALRRVDDEIEIRLVECLGREGDVHVRVHLPHTQAARTDLMGNRREVLSHAPDYRFAVRPQEIVTLRLRTEQTVPRVHALRSFRSVVPPAKWEYMHALRKPNWQGHPPAAP
jgi:hypothetical protein